MATENRRESLWLANTPETAYDSLKGEVSTEVVVVGGGITGLTTAIELLEAGYAVTIIEADRIASATSANTTAKLTTQHGLIYHRLVANRGLKQARQYAEANAAALEAVEERVHDHTIEANLCHTPSYVYAPEGQPVDPLEKEARAAQRVGLTATVVDDIEAPVPVAGALRFPEQIQFHPRAYLLGLAEAIERRGGRIFEDTRATGLRAGSPCRIQTDQGRVIAKEVVIASHFPFSDRVGYFARMHPSRAYLLGVELNGTLPQGMYLSTDSPPASFRPYADEETELLIVGGQSHTPSDADLATSERYRRCEMFAREHFDVDTVQYQWSAHDFVPVDGVPFIGALGPVARHTYLGTGFAKWGMSGGTAAGLIIADLIETGSNPWTDVFDPMRFDVRSSAKLLKENAAVGRHWVRGWADGLSGSVENLPDPGEGTVVRLGGRPVAVSRDATGDLSAVSAVCPHLYCIVNWNDAEETWDCPCHGSRFDRDGSVRYGPAKEGLAERELE